MRIETFLHYFITGPALKRPCAEGANNNLFNDSLVLGVSTRTVTNAPSIAAGKLCNLDWQWANGSKHVMKLFGSEP